MMQMIYSDAAGGFAASREYLAIRLQAHEHLLARIEEVGSEFSHWDEARCRNSWRVEIDRFVQLRRVPINTSEAQQIARDLLKEINGLVRWTI
jgi:pilus assembly protein CpaF